MRTNILKLLTVLYIGIGLNNNAQAAEWQKIYNIKYPSKILNTGSGIFLSQFEQTFPTAHVPNAIYLSTNLGATWLAQGLINRGVTDISSYENQILAGTFFTQNGNNGAFISKDKGATWVQIGPITSVLSVFITKFTIYIGTDNKGVWVSNDNGKTFTQKLRDGNSDNGIKVLGLYGNENIVFATSNNVTYKSIDRGINWTPIADLQLKTVSEITFGNNVIIAGTKDQDGVYISTDYGNTWIKSQSFGKYIVTGMSYYKETLYVGRYNVITQNYTVMSSQDNGGTWKDVNLNIKTDEIPNCSIIWTYEGNKISLYTAISTSGVYRLDIYPKLVSENRFLDVPWTINKNSDLLDKISSFFDHEYPLQGYERHTEPSQTSNTTLNFWGVRAPTPQLYYSSHSGIDFALPYGTEVKAAASGIAKYYYCVDCGNTIQIDHMNGYKTTYMHLQDSGIISKSKTIKVSTGDTIGLVGMTGNTTGPHLHFEVTYDKNGDGNFNDEFPQGRTDPFGWLTDKMNDPWENYEWTDALGSHTGTISKYLWLIDIPKIQKLILPEDQNNVIALENKSIDLQQLKYSTPYTVLIQAVNAPIINTAYKNLLTYVPNTSTMIEIYDTTEQKITQLEGTIKLAFGIAQTTVDNYDLNSLKVYFFDETLQTWEPMESILDKVNNTIEAKTNHLTHFAVLGKLVSTWKKEIILKAATFITK